MKVILISESIVGEFVSKISVDKVIKMIFTEVDENNILQHPIQIATDEISKLNVPYETKETLEEGEFGVHLRNYSLYFNYENKVRELNKKILNLSDSELDKKSQDELPVSIVTKGMISKALKDLVDQGFLVTLSDLYPDDDLKAIKTENTKILKSIKPSFTTTKKGTIKFKSDLEKPEKVPRAYIYILADDDFLSEIGLTPLTIIENEIQAIHERFIPKLAKKSHIISPLAQEGEYEEIIRRYIEDLETFEHQRLITKDFSFIDVYGRDLITYLEEMFLRKCFKCGHLILIPNNINPDTFEYDEANPTPPIDPISEKIYEEFKILQDWYYTPFVDLINPSKKGQVLVGHPLRVEKRNEAKRLGHNFSFVLKATKKKDYIKILKFIGDKFRCPKCNALIKKNRLFEIEKVIQSWGMGIEVGKNAILYGYPETESPLLC